MAGGPWEAGEQEEAGLPYCLAGLQNTGALFPLPHCGPHANGASGTIQPCSTPPVSHKNNGFNKRAVQLQFNILYRKGKQSMLPQYISSVYFRNRI